MVLRHSRGEKLIINLSLKLKMSPKLGINVVCFLLIAGEAEGLKVADIILTATGQGNDMVNAEVIPF